MALWLCPFYIRQGYATSRRKGLRLRPCYIRYVKLACSPHTRVEPITSYTVSISLLWRHPFFQSELRWVPRLNRVDLDQSKFQPNYYQVKSIDLKSIEMKPKVGRVDRYSTCYSTCSRQDYPDYTTISSSFLLEPSTSPSSHCSIFNDKQVYLSYLNSFHHHYYYYSQEYTTAG